ncbi:ABC transporter ATP-binding protein [Paracidovorax konjaci]|uniref:ABC transporter n=1 Tax=Paracidovorax konjaci TaxID=32040 RepID=A0A1I1YD32_9BURK|nr:ATP-binding cassette domain-containing protein [Paracidovorax konjaci]SFE17494.1 ABC transporter [Paracidovorax konjaci]
MTDATPDALRPLPPSPPLWECRGLRHVPPGASAPLFDGLDLRILPGTTLLRGGDGRGKTTLLRLIAGELRPQAGTAAAGAGTVFWKDPRRLVADRPAGEGEGADLPGEQQTPAAWWDAQAPRWPRWSGPALAAHVAGFGLGEHAGKRMEQLSTGTRRKVLLAAGFASGAQVLLVDEPVAALDRASVDYLREVLMGVSAEAAAVGPGHGQAVVVAHYDTLGGVPWGQVVELGD